MTALRDAGLWIWDFVVGDIVLGVGVAVAILLTLGLEATRSGALHDFAGVIFLLVIVATIGVSVWRGVLHSTR